MTGYTPIYNLPYPQASDLVSAYPGTGQDLAEEVETVLADKATTADFSNTAWTAYTPTITSENGTPTTTTAVARYKQLGKVVHVAGYVIVTNKGTATGSINVSLPVTKSASSHSTALAAWEGAVTGFGGTGSITTVAQFRKYDWTTFWVNNYQVYFSFAYEAA